MTVTVPNTPTLPTTLEVSSLNTALASTWENALQSQNYVFAHTGARIPGHYYSSAATTTSGTLTQTNSTGTDPDLTVWYPVSQLLRKTDNGGADAVHIEFQMFGETVEAQVSLIALDTGATITTLTATQSSAGNAWATDTTTITWANSFEGGSTANPKRNFAYKIEFRATSGTASLLTWCVHEKHLVAADLPTP